MKLKAPVATLLLILLFVTGFAQSKLAADTWRGVIKTQAGNDIPFNFEVNTAGGKSHLVVLNGA